METSLVKFLTDCLASMDPFTSASIEDIDSYKQYLESGSCLSKSDEEKVDKAMDLVLKLYKMQPQKINNQVSLLFFIVCFASKASIACL